MSIVREPQRLRMAAFDQDGHRAAFARDVEEGLTADPKRLPCRYLYDARGSALFEEICCLPEYYLTRTERQILAERAEEIAGLFPEETALVELGSGSAAKTRLLIEAFLGRRHRLQYLPIDISPSILEESGQALLAEYPSLQIEGVPATYEEGLAHLRARTERRKLILWLGSNVGNLDRDEAVRFLQTVRDAMAPRDRFLVGIDLRKERVILERAYDDALGVTAQFNLNLLARINRELGGQFDLTWFRHRAEYNEAMGRVEIYLDSLREQPVRIAALDLEVAFDQGEPIHTENSYKYSPAEIEALCLLGGFQIERQWFDRDRWFSVNLLAPSH